MLRLDHVTFDNDGFRLQADFDVPVGRKMAAIGPSGAGKSTLVNGIGGFHPAIAGRVTWEGRDITHAPPGGRPVAMLFQDGNLFPHVSVRDNAGLGCRPDLRLSPQDWHRVDDALARVGLGDLGDRKPATLSGGQQSRAALARVLVQERPLLLLDEPFAALGPGLRGEMLDLVATLCDEAGLALIMVTHAPADAQRIADEIVLVIDGVAHRPQPTAELLAEPPPGLRSYLGM